MRPPVSDPFRPRVAVLRGLVAVLATAALGIACSAPTAPALDASLADVTDAATADAGADGDDAPTDAPAWDVGAHAPLPQVPANGGPLIAHPALVLVSFADDTDAADHAADARWLVASDWLRSVGGEYGVGPGTVASVVTRTDNAPDAATDAEIQQLLADGITAGSIPRPSGADAASAVYVVYYPEHTTVTHPRAGTTVTETSCHDFGAYHSMAHQSGLDFAYIVIAGCSNLLPLSARQSQQYYLSHEFIEAATDPDPFDHPGYQLAPPAPPALPSPWAVLVGGELADLCSYEAEWITQDGFVATRVWSNAAALAGRDNPCTPQTPGRAYFNMSATPSTFMLHAGELGVVNLQGWSNMAVAPWTVSSDSHGTFTPALMVRTGQLNNGQSTQLGITVPAGTAAGSYAVVLVLADGGAAGAFSWPVLVVVQ